eukprot:4004334-Prymnesium_polylepis.1
MASLSLDRGSRRWNPTPSEHPTPSEQSNFASSSNDRKTNFARSSNVWRSPLFFAARTEQHRNPSTPSPLGAHSNPQSIPFHVSSAPSVIAAAAAAATSS